VDSVSTEGLATSDGLRVWRESVEGFFAETLRELKALSEALESHGAAVETETDTTCRHGPEEISHEALSIRPTPGGESDLLSRDSASGSDAAPAETTGRAAASSDQSQQRLAELARRLEAQLQRANRAES
jgi:hypothetical protein